MILFVYFYFLFVYIYLPCVVVAFQFGDDTAEFNTIETSSFDTLSVVTANIR